MRALIQSWKVPALSVERLMPTLFLIYLMALCTTHSRVETSVSVVICFLSFVGLMVPTLTSRAVYWWWIGVILTSNLYFSYPFAANHYFLTIYTAFFFALATYIKERGLTESLNLPRTLLAIVFGFATLQKFLSPFFLSGRLLASYFLRGSSLSYTLSFLYPDYDQHIDIYNDSFDRIADEALLGQPSLAFDVPAPSFILVCQGLAYVIVATELLVFVAIVYNKSFYHKAFPALMLAFLWGTFMFRPEYFFFSLVCMFVLLARKDLRWRWKALLIGSIGVFLSLGLSDLNVQF